MGRDDGKGCVTCEVLIIDARHAAGRGQCTMALCLRHSDKPPLHDVCSCSLLRGSASF